jgi:lipoprotein-anchoring transpeptidase ErfK/SrfK
MVIGQMRVDGRPQIVHAIGKRRVGATAGTAAQLTLTNTAGGGAVRLTAKVPGATANDFRVTVADGNVAGQDEFTLYDGVAPRPVAFVEGDAANLVAQVNAAGLAVSASLLNASAPLAAAGTVLAFSGGRDGNEGVLWYRLNLPLKPYGQKGWVPAESVTLKPTTKMIIVHRRAKFLEVRANGRRVFRAPIATGRADRPTPLGNFYVAAKYRPPQNAMVSAYALELSAPAGLPDFLKGGVVGIHGTPATQTIGKNASNGCIRVHNSTVMRLKALVPLGTPVKIVR